MSKSTLSLLWSRFLAWLTPLHQPPRGLLHSVAEAKANWHKALDDFNYFTDPELIDFGALNIKTAERRYVALLKQARTEGLTAWPEDMLTVVEQ